MLLVSGSLLGFHLQSVGDSLWDFARADLDDARQLVQKIASLGGEPTTEVASLRYHDDPEQAVDWLIEAETEAIDALKEVIPHTGDEGRSEALEHLLEHLIMRNRVQVDFLLRARGGP